MRRWWPWLLLVLALIPALLINQPKQQVQIVARTSISEAIFSNPNTLDPALATSTSAWAADMNVFETLYRISPYGRVVPNLVSHAVIAGKLLTLTIKPVKLANGGHMSASIVAAALARPLWPSVNAPLARPLLTDIVGSQQVIKGKSPFLSGIQVLSPNRLVIQLTRPVTSAFLKDLANPVLAIVPDSDLIRGGPHWQLTNLYGSAGYRLTNWVPDGFLSFRRFRGDGPTRVTLTQFPSFNEALLSFRNQIVDLVPVMPSQLAHIPQQTLRDVHALTVPGNLYLVYRNGAPGLSTYPGTSIASWVQQSFRGRIPSLGGSWPSNIPSSHRMTVYVNQGQPEAVQLADTLAHLKGRQVTVQAVSSSTLKHLAQKNQIGAYIGQVDWFSHGTEVPLAPLRALWLEGPLVHGVTVFANGMVDWHSVRIQP